MPVEPSGGLSDEQKARFHHATDAFRRQGPVRVTPQKLAAYLNETGELEASKAQRLRWLAIELEHDQFEHGWADFQAIYQAAAEADPADPRVFHSWGVSALAWAEDRERDLAERVAIAGEAERVLDAALKLLPRDSRIAHAFGLLWYNHPLREDNPEEYRCRAVASFTRAVEWEPANVIAQLFLAHCFHDREDWVRAIAAYEMVDLDRLGRDWATWRVVKCQEQLAHCHAHAGNTDEAVRLFTALLDEVQSWDARQLQDRVVNVDELVDAVAGKLGHADLPRRTRHLVTQLSLDWKYEQQLSQ